MGGDIIKKLKLKNSWLTRSRLSLDRWTSTGDGCGPATLRRLGLPRDNEVVLRGRWPKLGATGREDDIEVRGENGV